MQNLCGRCRRCFVRRPGLDSLLKDADRRRFDIVAAWSADRTCRTPQDVLTFLGEIHALGIDLYLHQQGVDTTTPAGKAKFQMRGVLAEFERSIIRERVKAGLARAKAKGEKPGRPRIDAEVERTIAEAHGRGDKGMRRIALEKGVGVRVVPRVRTAVLARQRRWLDN